MFLSHFYGTPERRRGKTKAKLSLNVGAKEFLSEGLVVFTGNAKTKVVPEKSVSAFPGIDMDL